MLLRLRRDGGCGWGRRGGRGSEDSKGGLTAGRGEGNRRRERRMEWEGRWGRGGKGRCWQRREDCVREEGERWRGNELRYVCAVDVGGRRIAQTHKCMTGWNQFVNIEK